MQSPPASPCHFIIFLMTLLLLCLTACSKEKEQQAKVDIIRSIKLLIIGDNISGNTSNTNNSQTRKLPATVKATDQVDLAFNAGHSTVWVVDEKTMSVHRRDVKTGDLSGSDSIRINLGLKEGEIIAISGVSKLQEGQVVRKFE